MTVMAPVDKCEKCGHALILHVRSGHWASGGYLITEEQPCKGLVGVEIGVTRVKVDNNGFLCSEPIMMMARCDCYIHEVGQETF